MSCSTRFWWPWITHTGLLITHTSHFSFSYTFMVNHYRSRKNDLFNNFCTHPGQVPTATSRRREGFLFLFFFSEFFLFLNLFYYNRLSLSHKSIFFCLPLLHNVAPGSKETWITLQYVYIANMSTLDPPAHSSICSLTVHSFRGFFYTFVYPFRWIDNGHSE